MNADAEKEEGTQPLVLVDEQDLQTGVGGKMDVHRRGLRHRAFSVFAFNRDGELLLQRRAETKYHSGGKWANTCCGHPGPEEQTGNAAERRLLEELNETVPLTCFGTVSYHADVGSGLTENEIVHCYAGSMNTLPASPNPAEVIETRFVSLDDLAQEIREAPDRFAVWLQIYLIRYPELVRSAMTTIRSGPPGATASKG